MTTRPVTDATGLANKTLWTGTDGRQAPVTTSRSTLSFTGSGNYAYAAFAPGATADWANYTASARITNLRPPPHTSGATGTLSVRVGSRHELSVGVSHHHVRIQHGTSGDRRTVLSQPLPTADTHQITIQVHANRTIVTVDGAPTYHTPTPPGPQASGGLAASSYRPDTNSPFARISSINLQKSF